MLLNRKKYMIKIEINLNGSDYLCNKKLDQLVHFRTYLVSRLKLLCTRILEGCIYLVQENKICNMLPINL